MKTKAISTLFVLGVIALVASPAFAGPTGPAYQVSMNGSGYGYGGVNGGAFQATPLGGGADWSNVGAAVNVPFSTFCAEPNVMGFGGWATIDNNIYFAGSYPSGIAIPSTVRSVLAYWFTGGYSALGLNNDAAGNIQLQAYIWAQIYGVNALPASWVTYYNDHAALLSTFGATYGSGHERAGDIRAMNLWTSPTLFNGSTDRQSQFIIVPVPAAALLGLIGFGAASRLRRKA